MRQVSIIGAGMGGVQQLTGEAAEAIRRADYLIGSPRLLEALQSFEKPGYNAITMAEVERILEQQNGTEVAILVSGDTGFYSAASRYSSIADAQVRFYPGISSVSAFCARLQKSWESVRMVSLHGDSCNLVQELVRYGTVFCLTGRNVADIGALLCAYSLDDVTVHVGENLYRDDERIRTCRAEELKDLQCASMTVLLLEYDRADNRMMTGISDEEFIRGAVPMTKQEVRAVILSKLQPAPDMIGWDLGAGTGSVSVELALAAWQGTVYAVECNPEGIALIEANRKKWRVPNLVAVQGTAPEAAQDLPAPDVVFIGGSKGNLRAMLELALQKNPAVRIVATAVTMESVLQLQQLFEELQIENASAVQVAVSRIEPKGSMHLFQAQNPVFIFSGGGRPYGTCHAGGNR